MKIRAVIAILLLLSAGAAASLETEQEQLAVQHSAAALDAERFTPIPGPAPICRDPLTALAEDAPLLSAIPRGELPVISDASTPASAAAANACTP